MNDFGVSFQFQLQAWSHIDPFVRGILHLLAPIVTVNSVEVSLQYQLPTRSRLGPLIIGM